MILRSLLTAAGIVNLVVPVFAIPATTTSPPTLETLTEPTSTSRSAAHTYTISVGKADHKFSPDVLQAEVGDVVEFDFFPTNHSVVRSEYEYPCVPYEKTGRGKVGFFSGFQPVDAILDDPPKFSVRINDSDPVFYYCSAPGSCIDHQMVGVINPVCLFSTKSREAIADPLQNKSVSLQRQKEIAKDASYVLQPGEDFPAEASSSINSIAATATTAESSADSTAPAAASADDGNGDDGDDNSSSDDDSGLSAGAIAGIAIGGFAVLVLAAALFFYMGRSRRMKNDLNAQRASQAPAEIINQDGVLYAPVGKAGKDFRQSTMTAMTEAPSYQQAMKSPTLSAQEHFYSPMGRSVSPGISDAGEWTGSVPMEHR